jgi:lipooligosaccharide transport system permease protein
VLAYSVQLVRPLVFGEMPVAPWLNIAALVSMTLVAFSIAPHLTRRRLLR